MHSCVPGLATTFVGIESAAVNRQLLEESHLEALFSQECAAEESADSGTEDSHFLAVRMLQRTIMQLQRFGALLKSVTEGIIAEWYLRQDVHVHLIGLECELLAGHVITQSLHENRLNRQLEQFRIIGSSAVETTYLAGSGARAFREEHD